MKLDKKTMFPANFITLLLFTAFCTSAVAAVSASTADMDMYDTTISNIITACCTGTGCDTYITPPTPSAVPPTPSAQVISLQWLLDNVDSMIAKVESCCCQDKMTTVNDSSVSVVTPDTTESITLVDEAETASTSASPYETSNMPVEVATVPDGLWCYTCDNAATNEECNEGDLVKCQSNQESCQSELRHSNGQARITKGCKQLQACENNAAGNVNNCPGQNDQSYCVYCCQGYGCNKYLPANPVDVGTKPPFEVEPSMATTVFINPTVVTSSPPSAPPSMAPVTPSVQMETLSTVLDIMDDLLPRLQSCCCGFDMAENQTMTLPDIDVTTSSLDLEHTTERGQPNFDWHENQTSATPPYSDDPVASSITVVITTPPTMAPVTPSVQMETLSTVLDIMDDLLPRLQSCCCGFDMAENQTMTLPDIDVTTSSLDLEHTTERGQPNFDWHENQTSATPPYSDDPVASSITVVITTPPTMAPVTPSVQMETLSTVLDIMDDLLPRLQSCCCGFDMAENQTSATPPYSDVTMSSPDVDVTMSSPDVVVMTTQEELPVSDSESPYQTSNIPVDDVTVPDVKSFTSTPVVASTPVVIGAPPTMAPVTPSVQMETLSSVLDIMDDLLPRLQSCCCGFDMAENQTSTTPPYDDVTMSSLGVDVTMSSLGVDITVSPPGVDVTMSSPHVDVTMSSSDVVMTTLQEELPVSDSESPYQTSNIPVDDVTVPDVKSFTSTPVVASTPVVINAPPTMAPVTPSVQMETLSSVLDIMDDLLPRLQSCCCGFDMAENQTSTTPPYDDVTMSSPGVDVTVSSPGVDVTMSSPHVDVTTSSSDVVMTTLQEELPAISLLPGMSAGVADACLSRPCINAGTCITEIKHYSCVCAVGFTGTNCEIEINECASSPCQNNGTCVDQIGNYMCHCPPDFYTGVHCETVVRHRLYPHGLRQQDPVLADAPGLRCDGKRKSCRSGSIKTPAMQIFTAQFKNIKIYSNGYITMGQAYNRRMPADFLTVSNSKKSSTRGFAMFAPLWTDANFQEGQVTYHIYDRTNTGLSAMEKFRVKHILKLAKEDTVNYGGSSAIDPSWVMVVTWVDSTPRMSYVPQTEEPNTFQMVLIYDPAHWSMSVMFLYEKTGWDHYKNVRESQIGFYVKQHGSEDTRILPQSGRDSAFEMAQIVGNTGKEGIFFFKVSSGNTRVNYDQKCLDWYSQQMELLDEIIMSWSMTEICPCDIHQMRADRRWKFDRTNREGNGMRNFCFYERMPVGVSTQMCCYNKFGSLISEEDGSGGSLLLFHPSQFPRMYTAMDVNPKTWCCDYSDNCDTFYLVRPMDKCDSYGAPILAWSFGDPHVHSLDNLAYTFNGLGEYYLIKTTNGNFTLQGRTAKAIDSNGTLMDATVFSAFAAKDSDSDRFHVEMDTTRTGFIIFVDQDDQTDWFNTAAVSDEREFDGVSISKDAADTVVVSFRSGFSLTITVREGQLSSTVGAPSKFMDQTMGLLGVFNQDPSDDLTPANGGPPLNTNTSSEKTIFFEFGETWRINEVDSLFYYAASTSYSTYALTGFQPLFVEDVLANMTESQRLSAQQTCGENKECLFDFVITGNAAAAAATLETNSKNTADSETLANNSPRIQVVPTFNVTVGVTHTLTVTTTDSDGDSVNLRLLTNLPHGATFDNNTGIFTWTPMDMIPVNISFAATDAKGGVAPSANLVINMCNCSGHGECVFSELREGEKASAMFRLVACNCSTGWTGESCDEDFDGCADSPCTAGTNCTDMSPGQEVALGIAFNCTQCPHGYKDNDGICVDVNECDNTLPLHNCAQRCINKVPGFVNVQPGFVCDCNPGYRLAADSKNCTDVDECVERSADCQQICTNTPGNFVCSCMPGYELNSDNTTCTDTLNLCERASLNCTYGCQNGTNGTIGCFCPIGHTLASNNVDCEDEDECVTGSHLCSHNCHNLEGGYNCSCPDGFTLQQDSRTCAACPDGKWGPQCSRLCNCVTPTTVCDPTTGCTQCPPGVTGGDCYEDLDECLNNPCDSNANCTNTVGTFRCDCHEGYVQTTPTECVETDECESNPCENGGTCVDQFNNYTCSCAPGYTGHSCQTDIDECTSSPCLNGGTCVDRVNKYRCTCPRGYTGANCQTEVDVCSSDPCHNSGVCLQSNGTFTCNCTTGYAGPQCQDDFAECGSNPCQNEATCVDGFNGYNCTCAPGFTGIYCESALPNPCASTPCQNGGTCTATSVTTYTCACTSNFTGAVCNVVRTTTMPATTTTTPATTTVTFPPAQQTHVTVSVRLTSVTFTADLSNKSTPAYKSLKMDVVDTLTKTLLKHLGGTSFQIVDVDFSSGSVVVDYKVAVNKDKATQTLGTIVNSIKTEAENGSFGNYNVDVASISATEREVFKYQGHLKITSETYVADLADVSSIQYKSLSLDVRTEVLLVFRNSEVGTSVVDVANIVFTKGSVVVDFTLQLDTVTNLAVLQRILVTSVNNNGGRLGAHSVTTSSIAFSDAIVVKKAGLPLVAIVIGTLLGAIALAAGTVTLVYCFCKKQTRIGCSDYNNGVDQNQSQWKYNMPLGKQDRVWQHLVHEGGEQGMTWGGVTPPPGMNKTARAATAQNIDWKVVRGFSQSNVSETAAVPPIASSSRERAVSHGDIDPHEWTWTQVE